jgi:hypothetical protein
MDVAMRINPQDKIIKNIQWKMGVRKAFEDMLPPSCMETKEQFLME